MKQGTHKRSRAVMAAAIAAGALALPVAAVASSNIGGGAASGNVTFGVGGVPPLGAPCAATSFHMYGTSEAFALNTVITGYAGQVSLDGNGVSSCESASGGGGTLTLDAHGTGPTGSRIDCTGLSGAYTRVATDVTATLGGTCVVNGFSARVSFVFRGEFNPTGTTGAGVTGPINSAAFNGAFAVAPA